MLNFILGEAGSGKSACIIENIKKCAEDGKKIFVIIPEQFSFEYERKMYNALGSSLSNRINVFSFTRLARNIFDIYGCRSGEYADDNTKAVLMYLAMKEIQDNKSLVYFTRQAGSRAFINDALEIVADLRRASVTPESFASKLLSADQKIRDKASDISQIYSAYDRILHEKGYRDGLTDITEAAAIANMNDHFEDAVMFIDEFDSFSPDECEIIDIAVAECSDVYISLCTPETEKKDFSLYATINTTYSKIKNIAKKYNSDIRNIIMDKPLRFKNKSVEQLSTSIFRKRKKSVPSSDMIKITEAKDMYQEIDFVCSSIKKLVIENGYRYGDISVISRQLSDYELILKSSMERYDIPYFCDTEKSVMHTSVVIMITSLLELAGSKKISTDILLRYAKTLLTKMDISDISEFENFCYKWNIDGPMWDTPFSETSLAESEDKEEIKLIDEYRENLVVPLINLRKSCEGKTVDELCRNIYQFFTEQNIIENIENLIYQYQEKQMTDMSSELNRLYGSIMDIFTVMDTLLGDEIISFKEFSELFTLVLKQNRFLSPPQKLDIVSVVSAEKARLENQKAVFIIGANEGMIPYAVKQSGFLSDTDKQAFEKIGIDIGKDARRMLTDERFTVYRILSVASERVYITYPLSDTQGGARYPSYILAQINSMFIDDIRTHASDYDILFYSPTKKSAYYNYVQSIADKSSKSLSLREALMNDPEYRGKIEYLDSLKPGADHHIKDTSLMTKLMTNKLVVSATSFEEYNMCHFKYFCHHALRIAARGQKEINLLELGNLVHMCLENIFSHCGSKKDFLNLTDEQIKGFIKQFSAEYREKNLGGDFGKNARFDKKFERLTEDTLHLVNHLKAELGKSKFKPEKYEFEISEENGVKPVTLKSKEGIEIILRGKIDRIDIYKDENGESFIRVIDYKTGIKEFSLDNIIFGIDVQMLLYLFSITENGAPFSGNIPAGILYMPSGKIPIERKRNSDEKIDDYLNKYYHMSGVVLKEFNVLKAMEEDLEGVFIPVKLAEGSTESNPEVEKKYKSNCLTRPQFERLKKYTQKLLTDMADELYNGNISASPLNYDSRKDVCKYCDYRDICGNFPRIRERIIPDDKETIKKMLDEIIGEEE